MTLPKPEYPGWRSLLFIPVHIDKFVDKAHTRGADAYILDLEDSVPLPEKQHARTCVVPAAHKVSSAGASALVRINIDMDMARRDLEASIDPAIQGIVLPKVESAEQVFAITNTIDLLEKERGMKLGHTLLIAMIESVDALPELDAIAQSNQRLIALSLGTEDFSTSAGMASIPETLHYPSQMIVFACRRAGIVPLGFPASIADYSDLDIFRGRITLAKQMGFAGALCIHPTQAKILNEELSPSAAELQKAKGIIAAYEAGLREGRGAVEFEGKMIDMPVVTAAQALLRRAKWLGIG